MAVLVIDRRERKTACLIQPKWQQIASIEQMAQNRGQGVVMNMGRNSNLRNEAASESEPKPEWIGNGEVQGGPKVVPNGPIPLVQPDDDAAHSGDIVGDNVATLKALFPQIVTDGKVDFDVLRQLLGDAVEVGEERYGLNWKGKAKARGHALTPTMATLRPAKDESEDWDTTQNLVIEGDSQHGGSFRLRSFRFTTVFVVPVLLTSRGAIALMATMISANGHSK